MWQQQHNGSGSTTVSKGRLGDKERKEQAGKKRCRHSATGTQLQSRSKVNSLDSFKRSYLGSIHNIWAKMPQEIIRDGREKGWIKITKRSKEFLMGKIKSVSCKKKKVDETQVVKVDRTNIETKN